METITKQQTQAGISMDLDAPVIVVFSNTEFYIHDGKQYLCGVNVNKDYIVTPQRLLLDLNDRGDYLVGELANMNTALDAYNLWNEDKQEFYNYYNRRY